MNRSLKRMSHMTKIRKLIDKLLAGQPIMYKEAETLLHALGYALYAAKSGSSCTFYKQQKGKRKIQFHKPHGRDAAHPLKHYICKHIIEELQFNGDV